MPRAPSAKQRTDQPEPRKGGSNWAMSPCSRYRSPPDVELSNIWLALQVANNEPKDKDEANVFEGCCNYNSALVMLLSSKASQQTSCLLWMSIF